MKVTIEFDTDKPAASTQISVDGERIGRVQKLALKLDIEGGSEMQMSRLLGSGTAENLRLVTSSYADDGLAWTLQGVSVDRVAK